MRIARRFAPYHEIPERRERRLAVLTLHAEGWTSKAISGYLRVHKATVHRILKRWAKEGADGLQDRPHGRPPGVRKVTLKAMEAIRRLQQNPNLGEYRIHAALAQIGIYLSPRTCGRILATHRELYGLEKPRGPIKEKQRMPFAARRRHQYWTSDVRYVDHKLGGRAYVISVMDNYSRAILASALTRSQDLSSYLAVLYAAVERYGSPEALVTDGAKIFRANQAMYVYESLGIAKHEIESGRPWQSYIETTFNIQRRMADFHFARAESWQELAQAHDRFVEDYNAQRHWGDREREDGAVCRLRRFWASAWELGTGKRSSGAPFSRRVLRGCWTLWATRAFGTGASTAKRRSRAERPPCGWLRRASPSSTEGSRFPATR